MLELAGVKLDINIMLETCCAGKDERLKLLKGHTSEKNMTVTLQELFFIHIPHEGSVQFITRTIM